MADLTDAANTLVAKVDSIVYPSGDAAVSIVGTAVKIYPGWPDQQTLQTDLKPFGPEATGPLALHISVFPHPGERNTTRYPTTRRVTGQNPATYTLVQAGQTITVGGTPPSPYYVQNLAIYVSGVPYSVQATAGQTAAQIAAALRAAIVVGVPGTTVLGTVITLPATARIGPLRVGSSATVARPVRQVERVFEISFWTDTPARRSALAGPVDAALADTTFLQMPDGFAARLRYRNTNEIDADQKQGIYRRGLLYTLEYSTTIAETAYELIVPEVVLQDPAGNSLGVSYG